MIVLTPADDEGLASLLGKVLHGVHGLHVGVAGSKIPQTGIFLLFCIRRAESHHQLGIGGHAAQSSALVVLALEGGTVVVDEAACGNAGAVGAVRTVVVLDLQGVEDDFRVGEEAASERQAGGNTLVVDTRYVGERLAQGLVGSILVAHGIDTLDAQIAVLVLEHRVGEVEASVNQSDDDALAGIGLGQALQSVGLALMDFIDPRCFAGTVGLLTAPGRDVDEQHPLDGSHLVELRHGQVDHQLVAHQRADDATQLDHLVGNGCRTGVHTAGDHEECTLLAGIGGGGAARLVDAPHAVYARREDTLCLYTTAYCQHRQGCRTGYSK